MVGWVTKNRIKVFLVIKYCTSIWQLGRVSTTSQILGFPATFTRRLDHEIMKGSTGT